jgi:murein DD-endopeptidase MepM/ murein hydrolase activator NlpD
MLSKFYIIQIIPGGSGKVTSFKISKWVYKFILLVISLVIICGIAVIVKISEINAMFIHLEYLKNENEILHKRQGQFEESLAKLDSVNYIENQLINILQTFYGHKGAQTDGVERTPVNLLKSQNIKSFIDSKITNLKDESNHYNFPSIKPVIGIITQKYMHNNIHKGIDFATSKNDPVFATASGKVILSKTDDNLGIMIRIDHQNGYETLYGHLGKTYVRNGSLVKKGQNIGTVGMTGNTTGPHVHYEIIKDGVNVNPEDYFIK